MLFASKLEWFAWAVVIAANITECAPGIGGECRAGVQTPDFIYEHNAKPLSINCPLSWNEFLVDFDPTSDDFSFLLQGFQVSDYCCSQLDKCTIDCVRFTFFFSCLVTDVMSSRSRKVVEFEFARDNQSLRMHLVVGSPSQF